MGLTSYTKKMVAHITLFSILTIIAKFDSTLALIIACVWFCPSPKAEETNNAKRKE